jgi:hypothetical protein
MEYVLYIVGGAIASYMIGGAFLLTCVILYVKGTPNNPEHARLLMMYSECLPKGKAYIWLVAIWYTVFCWAPIAFGWMKTPTELLNWKKEK